MTGLELEFEIVENLKGIFKELRVLIKKWQ